jgi:hypothetical protein
MFTEIDVLCKSNPRGVKAEKLITRLRHCELGAKAFTLLYLSSIALFLMSPVYTYVFQEQLSLPFALAFPFIDETKFNGYILTFFMQILFLLYALVGLTSFDIAFFTYLYLFVGFVGLLLNNLCNLFSNR